MKNIYAEYFQVRYSNLPKWIILVNWSVFFVFFFFAAVSPQAKACYGLHFASCYRPTQYTSLVGSSHLSVCGYYPDLLYRVSTNLVPPTGIWC